MGHTLARGTRPRGGRGPSAAAPGPVLPSAGLSPPTCRAGGYGTLRWALAARWAGLCHGFSIEAWMKPSSAERGAAALLCQELYGGLGEPVPRTETLLCVFEPVW